MPAKDLGTKHVCWKCGTKFYDLKKADPACPKCGSDPRAAPARSAPAAERRRAVREEPTEDVAESVGEADLEGEVPEDAEEAPEVEDDA